MCRFLCGTVNDFVAEVGKAYERATENKEEADAMAKKVSAAALCKRRLCNGSVGVWRRRFVLTYSRVLASVSSTASS